MPVFYGDFELRPVQGVALTHEPRYAGDGRRIARTVVATASGTIVAENPDGVFTPVDLDSRLTVILQRQKEIREALSRDGETFQIQGWDGGVPVRWPARVRDVQFAEGDWVNGCPYTIVFEGPAVAGEEEDAPFVESFSESWQFEEDEQTWTTRASHSIQAKGVTEYDGVGGVAKHAWQHARDFARNQLGLGWTTVGDASWSPQSGQVVAGGSAAVLSGTSAWNPVRSDSVDEIEGTYSASESFVLSDQPWWEEYQVVSRASDAEPAAIVTATVSGVIHGLFANPGDFQAKAGNAQAGWDAIKSQLLARAQATVAGATLSAPSVKERTVDPKGGTISYSVEFSNRAIVDQTWEVWDVTPRTAHDDYKTAVTVAGVVHGVTNLDEEVDPAIRLTRAKLRWEAVKGLVYARAVQGSGVNDLKLFPVGAQTSSNAEDGSLSYQYEFDNREHEGVDHTFTVSKRTSIEDGITSISVDGTIKGLRTASPTAPFAAADREERYRNAKAYWAGVQPNLLGVAALYVASAGVNPKPRTAVDSHAPSDGVVTYQAEFTTQPDPTVPGALSEMITVADTRAVPVVVQQAIPGRADGPILQDLNTVTAKEREVSLEAVFPAGTTTAPSVSLDAWAPAGDVVKKSRDVATWSPTTRRLVQTTSWIYV